jgi:hypothetical protein
MLLASLRYVIFSVLFNSARAIFSIAKFKRHKSPDRDQIPAEFIQAGNKILLSKIHNLINPIWNKEDFHNQ